MEGYGFRGPNWSDDSLYHHGVLGMKWGVRRYQNKDGSLTPAGQKHYGRMSGEILYGTLKRQVRNKRQETTGWGGKFAVSTPIGGHSKAAVEDSERKRAEYKNSEEYRKWEKKVDSLEKKMYDMDPNEFDSKWEKLSREKPKKNFDDVGEWAIRYGDKGREYVNDYLNRGGKTLSLAYLKDLGYNDTVAREFVDRMIKSNRTLGII